MSDRIAEEIKKLDVELPECGSWLCRNFIPQRL